MNTCLIILICIIIFFSIFAVIFEIKDQHNAYTLGKASEKDTVGDSLRKLKICMTYDTKTIKWRRILLATTAAVIFIFGIVCRRLPETRELLLYFVIIFCCFELSWRSYTSRTSLEVIKYSEENMKQLKKTLSEERSFIFPW